MYIFHNEGFTCENIDTQDSCIFLMLTRLISQCAQRPLMNETDGWYPLDASTIIAAVFYNKVGGLANHPVDRKEQKLDRRAATRTIS